MRPLSEIIIHCTATRADWWADKAAQKKVDEIRRWHVENNGWRDIGYHFLIDRDGTIAEGRPLDQIGAHVKGHNTGTVGISLFGGHGSSATDDFADHYTPEQNKSLHGLIESLTQTYGPLKVTGHNDYAAKACPGFEVAKWLRVEKPTNPAPAPANSLWQAVLAIIKAILALFR